MTKLGNMIFCSPAASRRCTISFIKTAADISENQIAQAALSEGMKIEYYAVPAEKLAFPDESFDVITACQCFWHFDHAQIMPNRMGVFLHYIWHGCLLKMRLREPVKGLC